MFQLIWIHFWQHLAVRKGVSCRLKLDVFHGVVFNDFSFSCTRFNSSSALGGRGKNTLIFLNRHKMRTQSSFNNCALGALKNLDDQKLQQMQCWQKKPFSPSSLTITCYCCLLLLLLPFLSLSPLLISREESLAIARCCISLPAREGRNSGSGPKWVTQLAGESRVKGLYWHSVCYYA